MMWLDKLLALFGRTPTPFVAPPTYDGPWRGIGEIREAADWIASALSSSGYAADFSIESFSELDRFFDEYSAEGEAKPGGLLSEDLPLRVFAIGAYVGEVLRHRIGGEWRGSADPKASFDFALELRDGALIWPIQRVGKRFRNGAEDALHAYGIVMLREYGILNRIRRTLTWLLRSR